MMIVDIKKFEMKTHRLMWFHSIIVRTIVFNLATCAIYALKELSAQPPHVISYNLSHIFVVCTNASLSLYPLFNFIKRDNLRKTNETKHLLHLSMVRTSPSFVIKKTQVEDSQL
jgi:hypothetical protein